MQIGIAYDLKSDFIPDPTRPDDHLEEYDDESTVDALAIALTANGHVPRRLGGGRDFVRSVLESPPDLVFNIAEGSGTRSREAHVPALLEMLGIPYTHSDPLTLALCLDKAMAKRVVVSERVPTPAFAVVREEAELDQLAFPLPAIAKPVGEGSSMGIRNGAKATSRVELRQLVSELLSSYQQPVLVEEFCPGAEFTVGIVLVESTPQVLGVMEIVPRNVAPEDFIYSLEVKRDYLAQVEYRVPPLQPATLLAEVEAVALAAFRALDCQDIARVDLRVGADGQPKFLEVNPLPGLHPVRSDLSIMARQRGIPYDQLIGWIVESARLRTRAPVRPELRCA